MGLWRAPRSDCRRVRRFMSRLQRHWRTPYFLRSRVYSPLNDIRQRNAKRSNGPTSCCANNYTGTELQTVGITPVRINAVRHWAETWMLNIVHCAWAIVLYPNMPEGWASWIFPIAFGRLWDFDNQIFHYPGIPYFVTYYVQMILKSKLR